MHGSAVFTGKKSANEYRENRQVKGQLPDEFEEGMGRKRAAGGNRTKKKKPGGKCFHMLNQRALREIGSVRRRKNQGKVGEGSTTSTLCAGTRGQPERKKFGGKNKALNKKPNRRLS